jgi:hypothetical protein
VTRFGKMMLEESLRNICRCRIGTGCRLRARPAAEFQPQRHNTKKKSVPSPFPVRTMS